MISLYTQTDLKRILEEIITIKPNGYSILGFTGDIEKLLGIEYDKFQERRVSNNIPRRILARQDVDCDRLLKAGLTEVRFLPKKYNINSGMWIYNDRSVLILPAPNPLFLKIRNRQVSKEFQNYFDIIWDMCK